MPTLVRERRLNSPAHVRNLVAEQINLLRKNESLDDIERARAIGYLSNILLTVFRDSDALKKLEEMERMLRDSGVIK